MIVKEKKRQRRIVGGRKLVRSKSGKLMEEEKKGETRRARGRYLSSTSGGIRRLKSETDQQDRENADASEYRS